MTIIEKQTLSKNERLKSRKIIEQLFSEGLSIAVFPIRITYKTIEKGDHILQAGFSASSRNFKKAVDRNRIKRLLRESFRRQRADLFNQLSSANLHLAIFIIFTGKEVPAYELVDEKMKKALKKLSEQFK